MDIFGVLQTYKLGRDYCRVNLRLLENRWPFAVLRLIIRSGIVGANAGPVASGRPNVNIHFVIFQGPLRSPRDRARRAAKPRIYMCTPLARRSATDERRTGRVEMSAESDRTRGGTRAGAQG